MIGGVVGLSYNLSSHDNVLFAERDGTLKRITSLAALDTVQGSTI